MTEEEYTYVDQFDFEGKTTVDLNVEYIDDGRTSTCFHVVNIPNILDDIIDGDDIIIHGHQLHIILDYPLSHTVDKIFMKDGFTKKDILRSIYEAYTEIYREEEGNTKAPRMCDVIPDCYLMNRMDTHGEHGIWGHEIGDLFIDKLSYIQDLPNYIVPTMGS